ncbi:MAG TPA: hypothetical protein VMM12_17540 [Longimicrobiales bacterium]|nr:hypothetical protein [Longimicrobiales bacterium]
MRTALRVGAAAVACAVVLAGCRTLDGNGSDTVSPDVLDAVRVHGRADVMVALVPPVGYDDAEPAGPRVRAEIARLQDEVLESLGAVHFTLRQRFVAVPALAGTVLSEEGLRALSAHPGVARVDLDVGGGGGTP